jgi:hypothetical protein
VCTNPPRLLIPPRVSNTLTVIGAELRVCGGVGFWSLAIKHKDFRCFALRNEIKIYLPDSKVANELGPQFENTRRRMPTYISTKEFPAIPALLLIFANFAQMFNQSF